MAEAFLLCSVSASVYFIPFLRGWGSVFGLVRVQRPNLIIWGAIVTLLFDALILPFIYYYFFFFGFFCHFGTLVLVIIGLPFRLIFFLCWRIVFRDFFLLSMLFKGENVRSSPLRVLAKIWVSPAHSKLCKSWAVRFMVKRSMMLLGF